MEDQETEGGGEKSTGGGQQAPPPSATEKDSSSSSSSASTQALPIRIKEEPKDDIKDFAETTMNELLGWYGYTDKVDHQDTAQLSLNNFRPPSTSPRHHSGDDISDAENAIADEHVSCRCDVIYAVVNRPTITGCRQSSRIYLRAGVYIESQ
ncbi:hypothetical protein BaRGS_00005538, partial [Batillaria attramentaria]